MGKETHKFVLIPLFLWDQFNSHKKAGESTYSFPDDGFFQSNTETESDKKPIKEIEKLPKEILSGKTEEVKQKLLSFIGSDHNKKKILNALFESPQIKISANLTIIVDNVDTQINVATFINSIRGKKAQISDLHYVILKAIGLTTSLVNNPHVEQQQGSWLPYSF